MWAVVLAVVALVALGGSGADDSPRALPDGWVLHVTAPSGRGTLVRTDAGWVAELNGWRSDVTHATPEPPVGEILAALNVTEARGFDVLLAPPHDATFSVERTPAGYAYHGSAAGRAIEGDAPTLHGLIALLYKELGA
jgi:hypothetical protein